MRKKATAVLLAGMMALSLAACGSTEKSGAGGSTDVGKTEAEQTSKAVGGETAAGVSEENGTSELKADLEYWSSWSETENQALALQEAAKQFMEQNPGVKINFTFNGRDNRKLVGSALEAGTKINMMDANADNIQSMWSEVVADLTPYFEEVYPSTDGKTYIESIMPSMSGLSADLFNGKYSYFPYAPQAFMIFCNKGIFEECGITEYPNTWNELMEACEKIREKGYIPVTTDANYCTSWVGYYLSRLMGRDAVEELSKDPAAWNDPKVLEAATKIEEMAKAGYFDPNIASNVYPNAQQSMVINGNVAMYINGTWLPNEVGQTTPEEFIWGSFGFPTVENGVDDQSAGCYSSYGIAIDKNSSQEEIDAAAAFAVYFTTEYDQKFSDMANAIPVSVDGVWPENLQDAKAVISNYSVRYPSQTALILETNSKQIISDACLKLMAGTITAEEFMKEASAF